jgi:Acetyltransferase (GNAT) domain
MHNDIDVGREELGEVVDELVARRQPSEPFGAYVVRSDDPAAELGRTVERAVFREVFGNTPELLATEYDRYERASVFIVVLDHRRRVPAGTMRVILPSPAGFKSLDDVVRVWGEPVDDVLARVDSSWDLERVWDLATLAVAREYRGEAALGLVTTALVQSLTMAGQRCGVRRCVAILDVPVLRMLQWRMGRPFEQFPGLDSRPYLGSPASGAVWNDASRWNAQLSTVDPVLHDVLFSGHGLEAVVSTPDWDDAAAIVGAVSRAGSIRHGGRRYRQLPHDRGKVLRGHRP